MTRIIISGIIGHLIGVAIVLIGYTIRERMMK